MKEKILDELEFYGFNICRLLSGSKTTYRKAHPNNLIYFNANIFVEDLGKIWWGDIDLTREHRKLSKIATKLNIHLYVVSEMDGRFGKENRDDFKVISVWNTDTGLNKNLEKHYTPKSLKFKRKLFGFI